MNLSNIGNWIIPFSATVSLVVVTIAYSISKWREVTDNAQKTLIDTLQKQLDVNDKTTEEMKKAQSRHEKEISELRLQLKEIMGQRDLFKQMLELQDENSKEFRNVMINAAKVADRADGLAKANNELLIELTKQNTKINENISKLFISIEKHLKIVERKG